MQKVMKTSTKVITTLGIVVVIGFVFLLYYEHKTACPDVAVYVKCKNFFD
jgi:hypothetical protein